MEMKFNENEERNEILKRRINQVLENWRGIYTKEQTSTVEGIKKYSRRKPFMSNDEYGIWCLCKAEGKEVFREIYNTYKKPFEKDEFVHIQKKSLQERIENDCRKLTWYLSDLSVNEKTEPLVKEVLHRISNIGTSLEETLSTIWEENKMAFALPPFYELKKGVEVYDFGYEPDGLFLTAAACCVLGIKTYEYDISGAVNALESSIDDMPAEADHIATRAVDRMLTRTIAEPIEFIFTVM